MSDGPYDDETLEATAQAEGITKEEVIKKYGDILKSPAHKDRILAKLEPIVGTAERITEMAKRLPVEMRGPFSEVAAITMAREQKSDDPYGLKDIQAAAIRMKHFKDIMREGGDTTSVEALAKALQSTLEPFKETMQNVYNMLDEKKKSAEEERFTKLMELIKEALEKKPEVNKESATEVFAKYNEIQQSAKDILTAAGYKIESGSVTAEQLAQMKTDLEKSLLEQLIGDPEKVKEILTKKGYKVVGGPMTWPEIEKLLEEQKTALLNDKQDDQRIKEVGNIIKDSIKSLVELFRPAVSTWFERSVEERATEAAGGAEASKESSPSESQKS